MESSQEALLTHQMADDHTPCGVSRQCDSAERKFVRIERHSLGAHHSVGMVEGAVERVGAIDQRAVAQLPSLVHGNRQTGVGIDVR